MQNIYRYIVCILLFTCLGFTQDTLITKQGKQYIGKVIDSDSRTVEFSYSGWDTPKRFYLNGAEVFLGPKIPKIPKIPKKPKKELKKQKYLSFSIKDRAIYDAKIKARKWVLYPIFSSTLLFGGFGYLTSVYQNTDDILNGPTFGNILGGALCLTLPYFTLDTWDKNSETQLIFHNYNDSEKEIYHSVYKKTFRRKKLLYSAIGIPIVGGLGLLAFGVAMSDFDMKNGY